MTLPATAPSSWYTDPAHLVWERAELFPRTWQLVARRTELPPEQGGFPVECIGEPVVIARDREEFRALSNVCRHRAGPVCREPAGMTRLVCGYHGWSYDLSGALCHAPELELAQLAAAQRQLPEYEIAAWEQWLFVRLSAGEGPSFEEWLGELIEEVAPFAIGAMGFHRRMSYSIACNWKVYIENFLEPYHLPLVHPSLHKLLDYKRYTVETRRWHSLQIGPPNLEGHDPIPLATDASEEGARWYWAFPNCILNCSFGMVSTNLVLPTAVDRCEVICDFFLHPEQDPAEGEQLVKYSHEVQLEDIAICEAVQLGLSSRSYAGGVLHPMREAGVGHFVDLMRELGAK